jgi:hypothetical protein
MRPSSLIVRAPAMLASALVGCVPAAMAPAPSAPAVVTAPPSTAAAPDAVPNQEIRRTPEAPAPTSPPPAARPPGECPLPPLEMLKNNIADTHVSGLAEIVASTKTALGGATPAPTTGYVNVRYDLHVLRWLAGTGPTQLVLHQGADADFQPPGPGELLFFSACTSTSPADGSVYEPDVGYVFAVDPGCRAEADKGGETAAKRAGRPKRRASACEHP